MFKKKFSKKNFSLIELLIVIAIMGALAALILPSFSDSESASKDTVCDYNQAGTLRYLNMFKAANGVYPTGFHTGANVAVPVTGTDATGIMQLPDGGTALTPCATYNFGKASTPLALTDSYLGSLQGAGIVSLAYGTKVAQPLSGTNGVTVSVYAVNDSSSDNTWTEELDPLTGDVVEGKTGKPLTVRGISLTDIATVGNATTDTADDDAFDIYYTGKQFKIVPLFVAPTMDWEHYYVDGPNDSKVSISMPGKCPWGEGGQARYYIAFFQVYDDADTPAKLLAISCPDCGILESDTF